MVVNRAIAPATVAPRVSGRPRRRGRATSRDVGATGVNGPCAPNRARVVSKRDNAHAQMDAQARGIVRGRIRRNVLAIRKRVRDGANGAGRVRVRSRAEMEPGVAVVRASEAWRVSVCPRRPWRVTTLLAKSEDLRRD